MGQNSSADWAEQEDMKIVRQGQMDSYYERFCEIVEMGLPGRVIDLDEVGLEHEVDDEKEERARYETEGESEINGNSIGSSAPNTVRRCIVSYRSKRPGVELCTSGIG